MSKKQHLWGMEYIFMTNYLLALLVGLSAMRNYPVSSAVKWTRQALWF